MPRLSAFTPMGQLRMSGAPSYVEEWYRLLPKLWGSQFDFSQVGTYNEEKLYAVARMCALMQAELEHAGNQRIPLKCFDLLPLQELDYLLTPGPKDDYVARQKVLAAAMLVTGGALAHNVVNALKTLVGGAFLSYTPNPAGTPTVYPASPGAGPGAFKDIRVVPKFLQLVDPIAVTGAQLLPITGSTLQWCAYQALDTSAVPTTTWSASGTFSVTQQIVPTIVGFNGFYFTCTTAGTTGTTEPTWTSQVGATVTDGSVTWTCTAPVAPALSVNDVVVVDAGNTRQMEKVTVNAVANTPPVGSNSSPGYLYFQATFTNSHDIGAPVVTGSIPYWWSTQRYNLIVLKAAAATDPATRAKVDGLLGKILRGVDLWATVQPATTTFTGGTVGPLTVGSPMGAVPIGVFPFTNSN